MNTSRHSASIPLVYRKPPPSLPIIHSLDSFGSGLQSVFVCSYYGGKTIEAFCLHETGGGELSLSPYNFTVFRLPIFIRSLPFSPLNDWPESFKEVWETSRDDTDDGDFSITAPPEDWASANSVDSSAINQPNEGLCATASTDHASKNTKRSIGKGFKAGKPSPSHFFARCKRFIPANQWNIARREWETYMALNEDYCRVTPEERTEYDGRVFL